MRRLPLVVVLVASAAALAAPLSAQTGWKPVLAGAAAENITPFTVRGYSAPHPDAKRWVSNPDGLPGRLWDTFPDGPAETWGQVTRTGLWGEVYSDENGNGRWDHGERWIDDPLNTRYDPSSAGKYDGVFLAGFGSDRPALGAIDPIWARALFLEDRKTGQGFAHVVVDLIGWFSDRNDRILSLAREYYARAGASRPFPVDHLVVSHTHNHEGPDVHVGLWGPGDPAAGAPVLDGTYPRYERYIEHKIGQAVARAAVEAVAARFRFGTIGPETTFRTPSGAVETLEGMMSRNSCRTPWVFDDELRIMQAVRADDGRTIGTLVNWGAHVESLEDENHQISSDFPHAVRRTIERELGGVTLYAPAAQGAAEIIGDSCRSAFTRKTYDGTAYTTPDGGFAYGPARTYAIGRVVGAAALEALADAPPARSASMEFLEPAVMYVPVNNMALVALVAAGVIDKPSYIGNAGRDDPATVEVGAGTIVTDAAGVDAAPPTGLDGRTTVYAWRLGPATFVTSPGELFPEMYWGLSEHNRRVDGDGRPHFDTVDTNPAYLECSARPFDYDTPGADTGRPFEPGIREAQERRWPQARYHFLLGYTPDLLGYIVPGSDFAWYAAPGAEGHGLGTLVGEAPDPCRGIDIDHGRPGIRYGSHYQETNSAGSMLAPAYACTVWEQFGLDPATSAEGGEACERWEDWKNGVVTHVGVDPTAPRYGDQRDLVRHH